VKVVFLSSADADPEEVGRLITLTHNLNAVRRAVHLLSYLLCQPRVCQQTSALSFLRQLTTWHCPHLLQYAAASADRRP